VVRLPPSHIFFLKETREDLEVLGNSVLCRAAREVCELAPELRHALSEILFYFVLSFGIPGMYSLSLLKNGTPINLQLECLQDIVTNY
jgi:hypothetical protein